MSRGASRRESSAKVTGREALGASNSRRSLKDRFDSYIAHHQASFHATLTRLKNNALQTLLTSCVVAIALALPALLMVALNNIQAVGEQWDTEPRLSLYLHKRAKPAAIEGLLAKLNADARVKSTRFISAQDALAEFEAGSGFGSVLSGLQQNPLPAVIEISLLESNQAPKLQEAFAKELEAQVLVSEAAVDLLWVQRFLAFTEIAQRSVMFLAALLAFGALLAIGNTIRLLIENRKDEIIVIKLVGGTNGFVRRPLLYSGGAYGFVGGVLAWCIVAFVLLLLSGSVQSLAQSYQSSFTLQGLTFQQTLALVGAGTALGWLGALLAVGRHLSDIEPT